jgi:hypothetical protein
MIDDRLVGSVNITCKTSTLTLKNDCFAKLESYLEWLLLA